VGWLDCLDSVGSHGVGIVFRWTKLRAFVGLEQAGKVEYELMLLLPFGRYGIVLMREKA
jgi:hypothetical protein